MKALKKRSREVPEEDAKTNITEEKKNLPPNFLLKLYQILER